VKTMWSTALLLAVLIGAWLAQSAPTEEGVRFHAVDIVIDSRNEPLAAYQLEFSVKSGGARIVGIEGGEHAAFKEAPFYDPKAIQQERVIIAAFNTARADRLPKGKTRIATIHLQLHGDSRARYTVEPLAAATWDGRKIAVTTSSEERTPK
jgi:hypothetical protein